MAFHLRNSVFAHWRSAAGNDEFDTEEDKEISRLRDALSASSLSRK